MKKFYRLKFFSSSIYQFSHLSTASQARPISSGLALKPNTLISHPLRSIGMGKNNYHWSEATARNQEDFDSVFSLN
jgi:hypothetical protein